MAKLFISYARRDAADLARRLQADLAAQGHDAWLDKREIQAGSGWAASIETAIGRCDALIALLTAGSYESSICRGEQLRALRLNKRLVPLLVQQEADRPIYLEAQHYLDFSTAGADTGAYAARLAELVEHIGAGAGLTLDALPESLRQEFAANAALGAEGAFRAGGPADWDDLLSLCRPQLRRHVATLGPRGSLPGLYERELHVERSVAQAELKRFEAGTSAGLLMVGEPGCGKTHLLVHWCEALEAAGDAVLFYPGDRVDGQRLLGEIARDLGFEDGPELARSWAPLEAMAARAGRRVWIVIDGLNDCRVPVPAAGTDGGAADAPRHLMRAVDTIVSLLRGPSLRIVASCTQAAWQRLARPAAAADGGLKLAWACYHQTQQRSTVLDLERYSAAEAEGAWALQAGRLELPLPWAALPAGLQQRLTAPTLLRLLAESLHGQPAPGPDIDLEALVFQRYLAVRIGEAGRPTLNALAGEMLARRSATLPYGALTLHPMLTAMFEHGQPAGALASLLDEGVLTEMPSDGIEETRLRFTYPQVAALAIVGAVAADERWSGTTAPEAAAFMPAAQQLVSAADALPLAWEAAIQLVIRYADDEQFRALASHAEPELRELALQSVVRLHGREPERARNCLALLLQSGSPEQQRTALRAIFGIGPAARDLLIRAALHGSPALKQAVRDTLYFIWNGWRNASSGSKESQSQALYFIWRRAPDFTRGLMEELVARLTLKSLLEWKAILAFVLDLSIQIYINHCERPDVVEQTAALFQRLTVEKLGLPRVAAGSMVERAALGAVELVFAERVFRWMLLDGEPDSKAFFADALQRGPLARAAPLLDPASDLASAQELLRSMLNSPVSVVRGSAALIVGVHAVAQPERTQDVVIALFDELDARARGWLLAGYCVLLPDAPPEWTALLEFLTPRLVDEAAAEAASPAQAATPPAILPFFDALYVPLALAYAKQEAGMPYFEALLMDAAAQPATAQRVLKALGIAGFYHPRPVLALLHAHLGTLLSTSTEPATRTATLAALATMRSLHFEAVDETLAHAGIAESQRRDVLAQADPARVEQFMQLLGFYNNAVHLCVHYPRMRRPLAQGALQGLADSKSPREFIAGYAQAAVKLARDSQFDLRRWTLPDDAPTAPAEAVHA